MLVRSNGAPHAGVSEREWRSLIDGVLEAKSMVLCVTNYGMLKFWKTKGDGKTWAERRADECVRLRRKQVAGVDAGVFAGIEPPPVATQIERMGGIRAVVIGGFNEHSAEVHRFIENAATAGASRGTGAEGTVADVQQAQLRKQFRQQMSVGAWKDLHTHILRRVAHINPTPAAEAKMLREKVDQNRCFREKRVAVARRRLDEGEALGGRAAAGRGRARGENSEEAMLWGRTAASDVSLDVCGGGGRRSGSGDGSGRESTCRGAGEAQAPQGTSGGHTDVMSSDLSPTGGRLRTENLHFAPSHLTTQSNRSSRDGGCSSKSSGGRWCRWGGRW